MSDAALRAELCIGIARRLRFLTGNADGSIELIPAGDFECGFHVLWAHGVALDLQTNAYCPIGDDGRGLRALILPDVDDVIREKISRTDRPNAPVIDVVLEGYLGLATNYAEPEARLPDTREPFRVPAEYRCELTALAHAGYADWHGDKMQWTDKAKPAMIAACCWSADGELPRDPPPAPR